MEAVHFKQVNLNIAEHDDKYDMLPSAVDTAGVVVNCFKLTTEEIARIVKHKVIWHRALAPNGSLQPFNIFAVRDYFDDSAWDEKASEEQSRYESVQKIAITMGFWQKLWFLFKGKEYIHVKAKLKSMISVPTIEINIKQDGE